jgi:hypothetical protein
MIATGSLGYGNGWDRRVRILPAAHRLTFAAADWRIEAAPHVNTSSALSSDEAADAGRFARRLTETLGGFRPNAAQWVLPLSGGVDSRGLLYAFSDVLGLRTVTWGEPELLGQKGSDGAIAAAIAEQTGVSHSFLEIAPESVPIDTVLDRFTRCSEGTVDHVSGYVDGFAVWRMLFEKNIGGIIRGDETFGWVDDLASEERPRRSVGLHLMTDYQNLSVIREALQPISVPPVLERREGETLPAYRDRLYRDFRVPVILAGLNKLKTPFVEVFNPWLSRPIIEFVRAMPDDRRTNKLAFREFVIDRSGGIPFASLPSIRAAEEFLEQPSTAEFLRDFLHGSRGGVLPPAVTDAILGKLRSSQEKPSMTRWLKSRARKAVRQWAPDRAMLWIKRNVQSNLDPGKLAFRAYLVERTAALMLDDAAAAREILADTRDGS